MITNPENLSKDRLKGELRKKGIQFSPSKNKDYYVSLYKQNVTRSVSSRQRSEFSSDDEAFKITPKTPPRERRFTKVLSVDHYLKQVATISDSQLMQELKKNKVDVGPITSSTRAVYENKLAKVLAEKSKVGVSSSSSSITIASGSDEEDEFSSDSGREETDEAPKQLRGPKPVNIAPSPRAPVSSQTPSYQLRPRSRPQEQRPKPQPRPEKPPVPPPAETEDVATEESFPQPHHQASWCNGRMLVQILLLLVSFLLALIVFDYIRYENSRIVNWVIDTVNVSREYFTIN